MERNIFGSMVTLVPIGLTDTNDIVRWRNVKHVKDMLYTQDDLTPDQHLLWLQEKVMRGLCAQYVIVENDSHSRIGTTFLKNIDSSNKKAEFGIFIGDNVFLGKGIGREATQLMLRHAFLTLNLNKVYLTVLEHNIAAIRTYQSVGFQHSGAFKDDYRRGDVWHDVIYMEILSIEYSKMK